MQEVEYTARQHNYHTILCNTDRDDAIGREYLASLSTRWVDGILAVGGSVKLDDLQQIKQHKLAIVKCLDWDSDVQETQIPLVNFDVLHTGILAANHFLELGHTRVACIAELPAHRLRLAGYRNTLISAGIALTDEYVYNGDSTIPAGYRAASTLLELSEPPTTIFATNDLMALGALEAATDHGLRVPEDVSILGLDDILLCTHVRPMLSTIALPKRELAMEATNLLLRLIEGKEEIPHCKISH